MGLLDDSEPRVRALLENWERRAPVFAELFRLVRHHEMSFRLMADGSGLELGCERSAGERAHRGRMKIVLYTERELGVFFYRVSASPESGDRFGYGALACRPDCLRPDQLRTWLDYVASEFAWNRTPRGLRRAYEFPIPD